MSSSEGFIWKGNLFGRVIWCLRFRFVVERSFIECPFLEGPLLEGPLLEVPLLEVYL